MQPESTTQTAWSSRCVQTPDHRLSAPAPSAMLGQKHHQKHQGRKQCAQFGTTAKVPPPRS